MIAEERVVELETFAEIVTRLSARVCEAWESGI